MMRSMLMAALLRMPLADAGAGTCTETATTIAVCTARSDGPLTSVDIAACEAVRADNGDSTACSAVCMESSPVQEEYYCYEACEYRPDPNGGTTADADACAAVTALDDSTACATIMTAATDDDAGLGACTYTTCEASSTELWAELNDGYNAGDDGDGVYTAEHGMCSYDFEFCESSETPSAECLACIDRGNAEIALKATRACAPAPDTTACTDPADTACATCIAKHMAADLSTVCESANLDPDGDEYWVSYEVSIEECVATAMALFPDPADRVDMAVTYDDDCCEYPCQPLALLPSLHTHSVSSRGAFANKTRVTDIETNIDHADWDSTVASGADSSWQACRFDPTYDVDAHTAAAEAACGVTDCVETGNTPDDCLDTCAVATATVVTPAAGGGTACAGDHTCLDGEGACIVTDCVETGNTPDDCLDTCAVATATVVTPAAGGGTACAGDHTCLDGEGACVVTTPTKASDAHQAAATAAAALAAAAVAMM
jgi:hypothetical protein